MEFYKHYLYCDKCGSFNIENWVEPESHRQLARTQERIEQVSVFFLGSAILAAVAAILSVIADFILIDTFAIPEDSLTWLGISLAACLLSWILAQLVGSRIEYLGVRCGDCEKRYENGSTFLTMLDRNPRKFSMKDVPPSHAYWVRGKTLGEVSRPAEQRGKRMPARNTRNSGSPTRRIR